MRRILVERSRRRLAVKHGGGLARLNIEDLDLATMPPDDKVLLIDEALERLRAEDGEKARIVTLKFFGGLTNQEIAQLLKIGERTVERQWSFAKVWLIHAIKSKSL
jgi:RNA polymerase sigma factor (TIGR02999 family)